MAARDKMVTLLSRLVTLTQEGKVEWRPSGEDGPYSYEFATGSGQRVVMDSRDDDGREPYDLVVYGPQGDVVSTLDFGQDQANDYSLINLWELARDSAAGTSQQLEELLNELPLSDHDIPF